MSRVWRYHEPGEKEGDEPRCVEVGEDEILTSFYPYWAERMRKIGKQHLISPESCLDDWATVHWAYPIPKEEGKE